MKIIFLLWCLGACSINSSAQSVERPSAADLPQTENLRKHKIIFQLSSSDTLVHKALMKQLNNIVTIAPGSTIEVVCHGPGLTMLIAEKSTVQDNIPALTGKNVSFVACEFSMNERKISKESMIPETGYVKAGIIEIVSRQEEGWIYIKSGF
jgi:intracellular sulfur oxidation DsrE/DsrF family protein